MAKFVGAVTPVYECKYGHHDGKNRHGQCVTCVRLRYQRWAEQGIKRFQRPRTDAEILKDAAKMMDEQWEKQKERWGFK